MNHQPTWLSEKEIVLPNGESTIWSYDRDGDILEVFFNDGVASATVELTDGVYLRFDRQQNQPLSLGIIAFQARTQHQEFGQPLLTFDGLAKLPELERQQVLQMLQRPPLAFVLHLYSFQPTRRSRSIPVASVTEPVTLGL